jgi:hypothetical protein
MMRQAISIVATSNSLRHQSPLPNPLSRLGLSQE